MATTIEDFRRGKMDDASRSLFHQHFLCCNIVECAELPGEAARHLLIEPQWSGVDRPTTGGMAVGIKDRVLAERLQKAIISGAAFCKVERLVDRQGKSYIEATWLVRGRRLNADLKRLGY